MGSLRVMGIGKKSYPVNSIELNIHIVIVDKEYEQVLIKEKEAFEYLKDQFGEQLKTVSYRIDQHTEYKGQVVDFKGYRLSHHLKLKQALDFNQLGDTLDLIIKTPHHPEFSINYMNDSVDRDELKTLAVKDAFHQAKLLSKEANVSLGIVKLISTQTTPSNNHVMYARSESMSIEDIEESVEVLMEWEI